MDNLCPEKNVHIFLSKFMFFSDNRTDLPTFTVWGHLRTLFSISGYCYPEVGNIFVNISVKTKIFSKTFWDVDLGPRYYRFMKKIRAKKSHASVPFNRYIYIEWTSLDLWTLRRFLVPMLRPSAVRASDLTAKRELSHCLSVCLSIC